jgi:toxin YoeB
MSYKILITKTAEKTIAKYKKSNPFAYKKFLQLLPELQEHPKTGTGHPEPLLLCNSITYSRRITANDRLIYDIFEEIITVNICSIEGHYKDK